MNRQTEALKLALEALEFNCLMSEDGEDLTPVKIKKAIDAIRSALAEQGCDYCNHPQYAGTKCKNCGREQPAQEQSLQDLWHKVWPDAGAFVRVSADDLTQFARAIEAAPQPAQPSKPWVGLTDEEMRGLEKQFNAERVRTSDEEYLIIYPGDYWAWQRAIEAKLREKNA